MGGIIKGKGTDPLLFPETELALSYSVLITAGRLRAEKGCKEGGEGEREGRYFGFFFLPGLPGRLGVSSGCESRSES